MGWFIPCPTPPPTLPKGLENPQDVTLLPCGLLKGDTAKTAIISGHALPLAGHQHAFSGVILLWQEKSQTYGTYLGSNELISWNKIKGEACAHHIKTMIETLGKPRAPWAGLSLDRPRIMGIVNVTPDSFSDGGQYFDHDNAIAHGLQLMEEGADLLDVGGESTRPDSSLPPNEDEELRRVIPVIKALAERNILVSVDTRRARVMAQAIEAGAKIINDVSALSFDPQSISVVAKSNAAICLMHMRGTPQTMGDYAQYDCTPLEVLAELRQRYDCCKAAGISSDRLMIDPGIGFAKTTIQNLEIFSNLPLFHNLGCGVLLAASRKRFISACTEKDSPPSNRLGGSLSAALLGLEAGLSMVRVHDVAATRQAIAVFENSQWD